MGYYTLIGFIALCFFFNNVKMFESFFLYIFIYVLVRLE